MENELLLEPRKTIGVKVPVTIFNWIDKLAKRSGKGKGNIVFEWIYEKYKAAIRPGAGAPAGEKISKLPEELKSEEKEAESGRGIEVINEEAILQKVGHFPKTITKDGLVRFLVSRGYDEKRAKQIVGLLVVNGTYIEKGKWLYLAKTKNELEVVVNEGN